MKRGIAFITKGSPYGRIHTGPLHALLMKAAKPPNKPYIAASLLMDAEEDWHFRTSRMQQSLATVCRVIKSNFTPYPPRIDLQKHGYGESYDFGGAVRTDQGASAQMTFESEVAATLNALYMASERVQKLVQAMTQAGIDIFKDECNDSGTGDGLNGITSRLFRSFEAAAPVDSANLSATREILTIRSSRTHTGHLNANYEIKEDLSLIDVRFYFLSPGGDGSRDYALRLSQLSCAQVGFMNYLRWFVKQVQDELGDETGSSDAGWLG